ncbi:MAG: TonB C-terminal domain-containing protein [Proteobacteria bacterium]|nr:TonB C-terminal domain-containing protein [Pseudomonadota bacterium]
MAYHAKPHTPSFGQRIGGSAFSVLINGGMFALFAFSSGSVSPPIGQEVSEPKVVFCRYIDDGRLFQVEVKAEDWISAEEMVCGADLRGVRLGSLLLEGARLLLEHPTKNALLLAQRESCSCSDENQVPILRDIGIVEAPRFGSDARKTALPRIINTPEPTQQNVIRTTPTTEPPRRDDRPARRTPSIDDLLNAATNFDDARPVSKTDLGGSPDGSRLSRSTTGVGDPYLQSVKARLDNTMNAPPTIPKAQLQKLSARLWIRIGDNGTIWGWDFTQKSQNAAFDRMIEMTMKMFMQGGNMRFGPPPPEWRLQTIPIVVEGKDIR